MLSEILLLVSGSVIFVTLLLSGRAYANRCADMAWLRKGKAMGQVHSSAAFPLAIILLSIPARPQSVPSSQVSANDIARRVITNELKFQDDHTNWMFPVVSGYNLAVVHNQHIINRIRNRL